MFNLGLCIFPTHLEVRRHVSRVSVGDNPDFPSRECHTKKPTPQTNLSHQT